MGQGSGNHWESALEKESGKKIKNSLSLYYPLERSRQRLKGIGTAQ
jgi:hypothetical protein